MSERVGGQFRVECECWVAGVLRRNCGLLVGRRGKAGEREVACDGGDIRDIGYESLGRDNLGSKRWGLTCGWRWGRGYGRRGGGEGLME